MKDRSNVQKFKRWAWWAVGALFAIGAALLFGRQQAARAERDRVLAKRRALTEEGKALDERVTELSHAKDELWGEIEILEEVRKEIREEEQFLKAKEVTLDERIDRLNVSPVDW